MAIVFVLGPGEWARPRGPPTPLDVRLEIRRIVRDHGHEAFLMEEIDAQPGEALAEKFLRLVELQGVTHILVYWPANGRMPTTLAGLVALRFLAGRIRLPRIWLLHQDSVADTSSGSFDVRIKEGKIAYLRDLARIGAHTVAWHTDQDLYRLVRGLAARGFEP